MRASSLLAALAASAAVLVPAVRGQGSIVCVLAHCSGAILACEADAGCRATLNCMRGCKTGNQTCQVLCEEWYGNEHFDAVSACMVSHKCMTPYAPVACPAPVGLAPLNTSALVGDWHVVRGLSPTYDCFDCQTMNISAVSAAPADAGRLHYDYYMRVTNPSTGTKSYHVAECNITATGNASVYTTDYVEHGIVGQDAWYVVSADPEHGDQPEYLAIYYCGKTAVWNYQGGVVISKQWTLSDAQLKAVDADIERTLGPIGVHLGGFCPNANVGCTDNRGSDLAARSASLVV